MTADEPLHIDGKPVTESNARRFVQARRPNATAQRETERVGFRRYVRVQIRDRSPDTPGWVNASGDTAGKAWLKVARQMVEHDKRVAAEEEELSLAITALTAAETPSALEAAALRYAAVRLKQNSKLHGDARRHAAEVLLEMATERTP